MAQLKLYCPSKYLKYAKPGDSGMDLRCSKSTILYDYQRNKVPTGVWVNHIPEGYELQVRPKSGLSLEGQFDVILGTVDNSYRGEIQVIVVSNGVGLHLTEGTKIAQLVLCPVDKAEIIYEDENIVDTERGDGGFGHTGY